MTIQELREKAGTAVTSARGILKKASDEKRELRADESASYDAAMKDYDDAKAEIDKIEKNELRSSRLDDAETFLNSRQERRTEPNPRPGDGNRGGRSDENEVREETWRVSGGAERRIRMEGRRATSEYRSAYERFLVSGSTRGLDARDETGKQEYRDLQADSGPDGGYLLAPMQMVAGLLRAVDDAVVIRGLATVLPLTSAQNLGTPTLDTDASDAEWTSEVQTGSRDTAMKFGKRELNPQPLAKRILISRKLLRTSAVGVESLVNQRLAYKFGITEEKGFLTGHGANQPLGVFTASANGISTGRDIVTGSATDFTADGLINARFMLKAQYWKRPSTRWLMHRDGLRNIRKLKDSTNQYLWQPGLSAGEPDRILDIPYVLSEYAPNTFTTGLYVGLLGDFSFYWIAEALSLEIQRLNELYAEANQVGYIGRMELDGMPVLEEAFVRIKTS